MEEAVKNPSRFVSVFIDKTRAIDKLEYLVRYRGYSDDYKNLQTAFYNAIVLSKAYRLMSNGKIEEEGKKYNPIVDRFKWFKNLGSRL